MVRRALARDGREQQKVVIASTRLGRLDIEQLIPLAAQSFRGAEHVRDDAAEVESQRRSHLRTYLGTPWREIMCYGSFDRMIIRCPSSDCDSSQYRWSDCCLAVIAVLYGRRHERWSANRRMGEMIPAH